MRQGLLVICMSYSLNQRCVSLTSDDCVIQATLLPALCALQDLPARLGRRQHMCKSSCPVAAGVAELEDLRNPPALSAGLR